MAFQELSCEMVSKFKKPHLRIFSDTGIAHFSEYEWNQTDAKSNAYIIYDVVNNYYFKHHNL